MHTGICPWGPCLDCGSQVVFHLQSDLEYCTTCNRAWKRGRLSVWPENHLSMVLRDMIQRLLSTTEKLQIELKRYQDGEKKNDQEK